MEDQLDENEKKFYCQKCIPNEDFLEVQNILKEKINIDGNEILGISRSQSKFKKKNDYHQEI